jgi:hypothetical protein
MTEKRNSIESILHRFCDENNATLVEYKANPATFSAVLKRGDYTIEIPSESYNVSPEVLYNRIKNRIVLKKNDE